MGHVWISEVNVMLFKYSEWKFMSVVDYITYQLIFVYQMGRLCGGAHEISGIKAPIFLCGWMGVVGPVVVGWVVVRWVGVVGLVGVVGWVVVRSVGVGVVGWVVVGWGW